MREGQVYSSLVHQHLSSPIFDSALTGSRTCCCPSVRKSEDNWRVTHQYHSIVERQVLGCNLYYSADSGGLTIRNGFSVLVSAICITNSPISCDTCEIGSATYSMSRTMARDCRIHHQIMLTAPWSGSGGKNVILRYEGTTMRQGQGNVVKIQKQQKQQQSTLDRAMAWENALKQ